jgi:hypothetical protein
MNFFPAVWMAIALVCFTPTAQDDEDAKFRALLSKMTKDQRDGTDWASPADAKAKTFPIFPWVRVYDSLKSRYPRSIVVDLREGWWDFTGDRVMKTMAEKLPEWVAASKQPIDSPERAREVIRLYIEITERPYRPEIGEITVKPEGEGFKATCSITQVVPSGCDERDRDDKGELIRVIACSRKQVTAMSVTLGRNGSIAVERKEQPSKGCRHVDK